MAIDRDAFKGPIVGQPQQKAFVQKLADGSAEMYLWGATALLGDTPLEQIRVLIGSKVLPGLVDQIRVMVREEITRALAVEPHWPAHAIPVEAMAADRDAEAEKAPWKLRAVGDPVTIGNHCGHPWADAEGTLHSCMNDRPCVVHSPEG